MVVKFVPPISKPKLPPYVSLIKTPVSKHISNAFAKSSALYALSLFTES